MMRAKALTSHGNQAVEPLMAYQPAGCRPARLVLAAGASRRAKIPRGGWPGFSVRRAARPPSTGFFPGFESSSCPATGGKIENLRLFRAAEGRGR